MGMIESMSYWRTSLVMQSWRDKRCEMVMLLISYKKNFEFQNSNSGTKTVFLYFLYPLPSKIIWSSKLARETSIYENS